MPSQKVQYKQLFRGQYAVFSPQVPEIYMRDYVAAGGRIASARDQFGEVVFCVCNDKFDVDFIAQWWNQTFRIVTRTFLYDCIAQGQRLSEETYSWGVDVENGYEVVPTWKVCEWVGPTLPLPEPIHDEEMVVLLASPRRKKVVGPGSPGKDRRFGRSGLLTPAPSIESTTHRAKRRKMSRSPSRESAFSLGRLFNWGLGGEREVDS
ncbi:hypothetical protein K438DRAFT_1801296 [Mycena galopus ATCC 62051]|nr:hypothetical protein K438DRAFT_1801296 [Mycena galopus ATCC 62051]